MTVPGLDFHRSMVQELANMPGARVVELGHAARRGTTDFRNMESQMYYTRLTYLPFADHGWIVSLGRSREKSDIIQADVTCVLTLAVIHPNAAVQPYFATGLESVPYGLSTVSAIYQDGSIAGNVASGRHTALLWSNFHGGMREAVMSKGYTSSEFRDLYPIYPTDCGPAAAQHLCQVLEGLKAYSPAGLTRWWPRHDPDY